MKVKVQSENPDIRETIYHCPWCNKKYYDAIHGLNTCKKCGMQFGVDVIEMPVYTTYIKVNGVEIDSWEKGDEFDYQRSDI